MPARSTRTPAAATRLTGAAAMWVVAAQLAIIFVLSNLPTPLYVIYREAFGFSEVTLTLTYAAYVLGSISVMFFFGRLSDEIGRRPVALLALALAALGAILFLGAQSTPWLIAARICSGLGIALASGAGTAWILELHPTRDQARATRLAIGANLLGLGIGPLLSGLLAQFAPGPLRLSYAVFLVALLPAAIATALCEETIGKPKPLGEISLAPRLGIPRQIRRDFVSPAAGAFATFAVLGFYSALTPSLLEQALHERSHAVAGAVVAGLFFAGTAINASTPRLRPRTGMIIGLWLLVPGVGLLVAAQLLRSMILLLAGTLIAGISTGLGYRCELQVVNEMAPGEQRAELISAYLIVCYAAISLPVVGIGIMSTLAAPAAADATFGALVVLLAVAALVFELVFSRKRGVT